MLMLELYARFEHEAKDLGMSATEWFHRMVDLTEEIVDTQRKAERRALLKLVSDA